MAMAFAYSMLAQSNLLKPKLPQAGSLTGHSPVAAVSCPTWLVLANIQEDALASVLKSVNKCISPQLHQICDDSSDPGGWQR